MKHRLLTNNPARATLLLVIGGTLALLASCGPGGDVNTGSTNATRDSGVAGKAAAPAFVAETFDHGTFDLAALKGRPVIINFWFPSCPPCTAEMPDLQEAHERFGDRVTFVGVQQTSLNTPQEGRDFLAELGVSYPNIGDEDGKIQFAYAVLNYPTTVFLDSNHNINRTWMGLISKKNLEEQVQAILGD